MQVCNELNCSAKRFGQFGIQVVGRVQSSCVTEHAQKLLVKFVKELLTSRPSCCRLVICIKVS